MSNVLTRHRLHERLYALGFLAVHPAERTVSEEETADCIKANLIGPFVYGRGDDGKVLTFTQAFTRLYGWELEPKKTRKGAA